MNENETEVLTPAQYKAIEALLTSGNTTQAATSAGVHKSTLYRWLKEPAFATALQEAEAEAVASLSRALAGLGEDAAQALRDALAKDVKMSIRVRAAEIVTDRLLKIRELVNLEARIAELEKRAHVQN